MLPWTSELVPGYVESNDPCSDASARNSRALSSMIGVARKDADGAVDLLQQHDAHELVRPGDGAEREPHVCLIAETRGKTVVAADDEHGGRAAIVAPTAEPRRQRRAVEALAALVENKGDGLVRNDIGQRGRFFGHPLADLLGPAFADFHDIHVAKADAPPGLLGALAIALGELALGAVLDPADGGNHQPHVVQAGFCLRAPEP